MAADTDLAIHTPSPSSTTHPDALATAALVCGIASFIPLTPPIITPLAAIVLGLRSARHAAPDGRARRSSRAVTGISLGCLSLAILATICIVYFGVLGYPLPHLQHYQPGR